MLEFAQKQKPDCIILVDGSDSCGVNVILDPDNFDEGIQMYAEFSAAARLMWAPRYNLALEQRLQRLSCPSLIVGGEEDRLVPNEMSDKYAEVLPNSRLTRIEGTGHEPLLERPEQLTQVLTSFIQEASA